MSIKKTIKKVVEEYNWVFMLIGIGATASVVHRVVGYTLVKIIDKVVR